MTPGLLYGIHLDTPYHHARHYRGWSRSRAYLIRRIAHHANGRGSRFLNAVTRAGIGWRVVVITPGSRTDERAWKNGGGHPERWCPVCQGRRGRLRADYWRVVPVPRTVELTDDGIALVERSWVSIPHVPPIRS